MPTTSAIVIALLMTLFAGSCTAIGALLSFLSKKTNTKMLAWALGLSAGVMVYVSFMELLPQAMHGIGQTFGAKSAEFLALVAFFGGILLIALIDYFVPEDENPHEMHDMSELRQSESHHMKRTGMMLALAIGIHNFPEGIATFVSALDGLEVALPIVVAIAIHNIPEGIAVSVPIYYSTGKRRKAFMWAALSGIAEPVGAVVAMLFLMPFWSPMVNAICLAAVAGIMVYISFDELLPSAESHGHHHMVLIGVIVGMALMAATMIFI